MKETIQINDTVIIYQAGMPVCIARVVNITPDHKPNWYNISFIRSFGDAISPIIIPWSWKLDSNQIAGEAFTIGGVSFQIGIYSRTVIEEPKKESMMDKAKREMKEVDDTLDELVNNPDSLF